MQSSTKPSSPRKRRRTAKSCEQCRNRKVGCDQAHPCGPCRRSRDHLICTYRDSANTAPPHIPPVSHSLENEQRALETGSERPYPHQTSRFEALDTGLVPTTRVWATHDSTIGSSNHHGGTDAQSLQSRAPTDLGGRADETIHKLEERIQRLEAEARSTHREVHEKAPSSTLPVSATTAPRLRFTKAKVKFFAQSHWVHTAEKVCLHVLWWMLGASSLILFCLPQYP